MSSLKRSQRRPVGWAAVLLLAVVGGAFAWWFQREKARVLKARGFGQTTIGTAQIGGRWTLVDTDGNPVTERDFAGRFQLIYFGFTMCPDICPVELQKIATLMEFLNQKGLASRVVPLFVTVDPKRDSLQIIRDYLRDFHPDFVGLAGTPDQVQHITKQFRVYISSGQTAEGDADYLVDHSVVIYLVDGRNKFVEFYATSQSIDTIQQRLLQAIDPHPPTFWEVISHAFL